MSLEGLYKAFSCSVGITLTRGNSPKTSELITRANADVGSAANILKQLYQHKRPYQVDEADICLSPQGKAALERSADYPSGHTAASWEDRDSNLCGPECLSGVPSRCRVRPVRTGCATREFLQNRRGARSKNRLYPRIRTELDKDPE